MTKKTIILLSGKKRRACNENSREKRAGDATEKRKPGNQPAETWGEGPTKNGILCANNHGGDTDPVQRVEPRKC